MSRIRFMLAITSVATCIAVAGGGCGSSPEPTAAERSEQALKDPMNYKVDFSRSRVSSGGITHFDKDGFKRDLNSVLNP